jgi:hypothetical protein
MPAAPARTGTWASRHTASAISFNVTNLMARSLGKSMRSNIQFDRTLPADRCVVVVANALSMREWAHWFAPAHVMGRRSA